jgi:hypothetical protein
LSMVRVSSEAPWFDETVKTTLESPYPRRKKLGLC